MPTGFARAMKERGPSGASLMRPRSGGYHTTAQVRIMAPRGIPAASQCGMLAEKQKVARRSQ
jgi:hypothetical protein